MRILVTDGMDKGAIEKVRAMGHELVEQFYEPDELGKALRDFDVAIIRSKTKLRAKQIDDATGSWLWAICSPAPATSPSPATPCARASGRRRPTARASS